MTEQTRSRQNRPRLDPGERDRILAEIARLNPPSDPPQVAPVDMVPPAPGPSGLADLRAAVIAAQGDDSEPEVEVVEAAAADPVPSVESAREPELPPEPAQESEPHTAPAVIRAGASALTRPDPAAAWSALRTIPVDARQLDRNLVITAARTDPAHGAFDVLRTRMVQAMADRGWKRVGITSPTKGCGKSFTALNLAVALSRYGQHRAVLLDLDMRIPALAKYLGVTAPGSIADMLRGQVAPEDHLCRFGDNSLRIGANVALGLNDRREAYASELFQDQVMTDTLARIDATFAPDVMLFDLPPALAQDDVIALRPHYDCILMVVGGGVTTPREVREAVRRIGDDKPVLGMILNKADGQGVNEYAY